MECPDCSSKLRTTDTRPDGSVVRRKRQCPNCGTRIETIELATTDAAALAGRIGQQRKRLIDGLLDLLRETDNI